MKDICGLLQNFKQDNIVTFIEHHKCNHTRSVAIIRPLHELNCLLTKTIDAVLLTWILKVVWILGEASMYNWIKISKYSCYYLDILKSYFPYDEVGDDLNV